MDTDAVCCLPGLIRPPYGIAVLAAGTAQVLNMLAAQQQQEAIHSSQLLAALAAMGSDSPRHIRALAEALAASFSEEGYFHREQQQQAQQGSQMQQQAKAAVAAAVLRDQQRSRSASPNRPAPACFAEELRVSLSHSGTLSTSGASSPRRMNVMRVAGLQQPGSPTTPCTPEFASPEMSFRTSYASSSLPLHAGMAAVRTSSQRVSTCSTVSHSSVALPPPAAAAGLGRLNDSSRGSSGSSGRGSYGSGCTAASGSCGYGSPASCGSPNARHSGASGSSSTTSSKNKYYPEVPDPEVQLEKPKRVGRRQWKQENSQAAAATAGGDVWHSCEINSPEDRAAVAAADSGPGVHDKSRLPAAAAAEGGRRKSRFNQQASPDSASANARRSVKSFPLANLELER
jgi:hypothetical protein